MNGWIRIDVFLIGAHEIRKMITHNRSTIKAKSIKKPFRLLGELSPGRPGANLSPL